MWPESGRHNARRSLLLRAVAGRKSRNEAALSSDTGLTHGGFYKHLLLMLLFFISAGCGGVYQRSSPDHGSARLE